MNYMKRGKDSIMRKLTWKKLTATTLTIIISLILPFSTACNNKPVVNEYPEAVVDDTNVDPDTNDENTDDTDPNSEYDEALLPEYDSLKEEGKYHFDPAKLNRYYKMQVSDNPKIILIAKRILEEVYECHATFELDGEYECTDAEFQMAYALAARCNPIMDVVRVEREENTTFVVKYFPYATRDDNFQITYDEGIAPEEAKVVFDEFADVITAMINDNLTQENTEKERAEIIYKAIVDNTNVKYNSAYTTAKNPEDVPKAPSEDDEEFDEEAQAIFMADMEAAQINGLINGKCFLERINTNELSQTDTIALYSFVLTQLNIDCMIIGAQGMYEPQNIKLLDDTMNGLNFWLIVNIEGKDYHCDIRFDKAMLDSQRIDFPDSEVNFKYFGMSDAKRKESFNYDPATVTGQGTINPMKAVEIPECPDDLN